MASHFNTANSCCHHVFLRHFRFQKCLPVNDNSSNFTQSPRFKREITIFSADISVFRFTISSICARCGSVMDGALTTTSTFPSVMLTTRIGKSFRHQKRFRCIFLLRYRIECQHILNGCLFCRRIQIFIVNQGIQRFAVLGADLFTAELYGWLCTLPRRFRLSKPPRPGYRLPDCPQMPHLRPPLPALCPPSLPAASGSPSPGSSRLAISSSFTVRHASGHRLIFRIYIAI